MASPKFFMCACALLLVQAQAHPQPQVEMVITDFLKKIVPIAEEAIDRIFQATSKKVYEASNNPVAYQMKTVEKLDNDLDKYLDLLNEKLDRIKEGGSDNIGKIIDCVKDARLPSKKVVVGFYNRTTQCIAPVAIYAVNEYANIIPDLQYVLTKSFLAADKVQDCSGTNAEESICVAKVIEGVLNVLGNVEWRVEKVLIDIILNTLGHLDEYLPKCITPNVDQARSEAIETLNSITACIVA